MSDRPALRAVLLIPLFLLHCPEIYIFFFKARWYLGLSAVFALWLFLLFVLSMRRRGLMAGFFVAYGLYVLVLSFGIFVPSYFVVAIGGWLKLILAFSAGVVLLIAVGPGRLRVFAPLVFLVLLWLLLSDVYIWSRIQLVALAAAAIALGMSARPVASDMAFAGVGISLFAMIVNFWIGVPMHELDSVKSQSDIRAILDYGKVSDIPLLSDIPYRSDLKFVIESCEPGAYIIGVRRKVSGLLRLTPSNLGNFMFREVPEEVADNAAVDCSERLVYYGGRRSGVLYVADERTLDVRAQAELGRPRFGPVYLGDGCIYVLFDQLNVWAAMDRDDLRNVRWIEAGGFNNGLVLDRASGLLYHLTSNGIITLYKSDDFEVVASARVKGGGLAFLNMALASDLNRLFVFSMQSGDVWVFDASTLKLLRTTKVPAGVRFSVYNPKNRRLYVANYFKGELYEIEPRSMRLVRRWYLGPRLRWLEVSRDGREVLATSSLGAFAVELGDG